MATETAQTAAPASEKSSKLQLPPRMAVQNATELLDELKSLQGQDVDLEASSVMAVSTPCLQVLLAAGKHWRDNGHQLRIIDPSTDFLIALDHLGISRDALESPEKTKCP